MAHRHPDYPYFTREICKRGILREPFRLLDIGVRGGIANHWLNFGDYLHAWGFDVLHESVAPLIEANSHPDRLHYFNVGLGEQDTTRAFRFYPDNPWSSHFAASNGTDQTDESWQNVPIRRLDSLYAEGTIGPIDFMKVDAESYEIEIVKGARELFRNSGIFGVEAETKFQRTPAYPRSHFVELYEELAPYEFSVCDAGLQRVPRRPLAHGFPNEATPGEYVLRPIGAAWVFDFLFLNDIFENTARQSAASPDRLLKMIAVAEIYGLQDIGLDILFGNRERLVNRFDVEEGADWLIRQHPDTKLTYRQYLAATNSAAAEVFPEVKPGSGDFLPQARFAELEALLAQKERRLAETDAELRAIRESVSWRMIAALRKATRRLRN
jgi:FkbM family methyltransferase